MLAPSSGSRSRIYRLAACYGRLLADDRLAGGPRWVLVDTRLEGHQGVGRDIAAAPIWGPLRYPRGRNLLFGLEQPKPLCRLYIFFKNYVTHTGLSAYSDSAGTAKSVTVSECHSIRWLCLKKYFWDKTRSGPKRPAAGAAEGLNFFDIRPQNGLWVALSWLMSSLIDLGRKKALIVLLGFAVAALPQVKMSL